MPIYANKNGTITQIKEKPFKLEKEIQQLFESNLNTIMGLELVKSEFSIKNKRIDSLAYDAQNKAFIIIEYKRDKNISVVDQGFTYLSLMLENKADFIVEYNESLKKQLKRDEVLNRYEFSSINQVRLFTGAWMWIYNNERPHKSLGYKTPSAFMEEHPRGGTPQLFL